MLIRNIHRPLAWLALAVALAIGVLLAVAMRQAHASEPAQELPNLVADPPDNVNLAVDSSTGTNLLLLRFNGYIHNAGPGALDFRGSREAPKVSREIEEEVQRAEVERAEGKKAQLELPQKTEAELAAPPMQVFQRIFTTDAEEFNIERPHVDEPSSGEMVYVNADGHHHWHLQRVARYSLWNSTKTAEVAPAQKVGFCLEDSEHVQSAVGPEKPVYSDGVPPFRDFCQQYHPEATGLFEGVSPGWRDLYRSNLAFQWVDVSDVLPGEYWLREDVNPTGAIKEAGGLNTPAYATAPTIVPGFDALAQSIPMQSGGSPGESQAVTLTARAYNDSAVPEYAIVSQPRHGTLGAVIGNQVTYMPEPGYSGPDSFTFSAADPNSQFPSDPAIATVAIEGVAIGGAPSSMYAGTSVQLSATADGASGAVEWSASAGTITAEGLYTAPATPPPGGAATIVARTMTGAQDRRTIAILPVPSAQPAPQAVADISTSSATAPNPAASRPSVSRPQAILIGHKLVMTTRVSGAGRVRLTAYLAHRVLGGCVVQTPGEQSFTCRLTLGRRVRLNARIGVLASLRVGGKILRSLRPAAPVAEMTMSASAGERLGSVHGRESVSWRFLCSPPTM